MYLECKTKRIFAIAFLGKKLVFQSEISTYSLIIRLLLFSKNRSFIGSRSCPNFFESLVTLNSAFVQF